MSTEAAAPAPGIPVAAPPEFKVMFLGSHDKHVLFEKLKSASEKWERHVQYGDTYFLTVRVDGNEYVLELTDTGLEHTGAREMGIRKAAAVVLTYAASNAESFNQLPPLLEDFKLRKHGKFPPVKMLCNEDDVYEDECDGEDSSAGATSVSEGYESETPHPVQSSQLKRRRSMKEIRNISEMGRITRDQGEEMSQQFGPKCEFRSFSFSNFSAEQELIESIVRAIIRPATAKPRRRVTGFAKVRDSTAIKQDAKNSTVCVIS
uniref:DRBM domain-containing protein n=2 Tax=Steinernema glaseri TaxID=37863 RepID=A0A1I7ZUG8_9BILA